MMLSTFSVLAWQRWRRERQSAGMYGAMAAAGTDGPTDAAGAVIDDHSLARAQQAGLDWQEHLRNNDAYPFFECLGDLLKTGPTQTNVMDMHVLLVQARPA